MSNLNQHIKAVHLELKPFTCKFPECGMTFSFKHVRDRHERSACHVYTCVSVGFGVAFTIILHEKTNLSVIFVPHGELGREYN